MPNQNWMFQLCVDYRPSNDTTVADVYPLPRIDEIIDNAGGSRWFLKIDLYGWVH